MKLFSYCVLIKCCDYCVKTMFDNSCDKVLYNPKTKIQTHLIVIIMAILLILDQTLDSTCMMFNSNRRERLAIMIKKTLNYI